MRAFIAGLMIVVVCLGACTEDEGESFDVELSGANEVCDDPKACGGDGSGTAEIEIDADENKVCYEFELEGIDGVEAAHIHAGDEGQSGDPVVDLGYSGGSEPLSPSSRAEGCIDGIDESVLEDVLADPDGFYVNVHTADLPDGAGRAQLSD